MEPRQATEIFHLLFLAQLGPRLDKRLYAVKGGCNLRFFLRSPRLSEDLDLDVHTVAKHTLHKKVSAILESRPLRLQLAAQGMEIARWSAPKQTETTQRWKIGLIGLALASRDGSCATKIEFSRRGDCVGAVFDPVDPALVRTHALPPISASHYPPAIAFEQKVRALAHREATQARDLFDLDLLLRSGVEPAVVAAAARSSAARALAVLPTVTFDLFKSQVVAYLPPDAQAAFDTEDDWGACVARVRDALGELGS